MAGNYTHSMDQEFTPNIQEIGASSNPFQHQTEALKARIFHGASRVEFSFFGQGKTNKEQPGPESFGKTERQAQFRAVITLINHSKMYQFEGILIGEITRSVRGTSGFGYDPIFIDPVTGKRFAELPAEVKNRVSHRALALIEAKRILQSVLSKKP